jgi:hypothetical protein
MTHLSPSVQLRLLTRPIPFVLRRSLKHIEEHVALLQVALPRLYFENTRAVRTSIAVVRGGPYGREVVVEEYGEPFHAKLVGA